MRRLRIDHVFTKGRSARLRCRCEAADVVSVPAGAQGQGQANAVAGGTLCRGGDADQAEPALEIVRQSMPEHDDARLGTAADEEAREAVLAHAGVDALGQAAPSID